MQGYALRGDLQVAGVGAPAAAGFPPPRARSSTVRLP